MKPGGQGSPGLDSSLQYLKGVGPQRARLFERLGLVTVRDALNHFPGTIRTGASSCRSTSSRSGRRASCRGPSSAWRPHVRLPGSRPGDLPGPGGLLHRPLVRATLSSARTFKRDQRVVPLRQEGARRGPPDRARRTPSSRSVEDAELASIHMGRVSCPSIPRPRACSRSRCAQLQHGTSSRPTPRTRPTSCRRGSAGVAASSRWQRRTARSTSPATLEDVEAARRRFAFEDFFVLQVGLALKRRRQARGARPAARAAGSASSTRLAAGAAVCPRRPRRSASGRRSGRTSRARSP